LAWFLLQFCFLWYFVLASGLMLTVLGAEAATAATVGTAASFAAGGGGSGGGSDQQPRIFWHGRMSARWHSARLIWHARSHVHVRKARTLTSDGCSCARRYDHNGSKSHVHSRPTC